MGEVVKVYLVRPELAPRIWPHVRKYVARALMYNLQGATEAGVYSSILQNQSFLWVLITDTAEPKIKGCCVCQVYPDYMGVLTCEIILVGGEDMALWEDKIQVVEEWARELEVVYMTGMGRPGWKSWGKKWGWKAAAVLYMKTLDLPKSELN